MELQTPLLDSLHGLSKAIDEKVHLLASKGDQTLSELALEVTKHLLDLGMSQSLSVLSSKTDAIQVSHLKRIHMPRSTLSSLPSLNLHLSCFDRPLKEKAKSPRLLGWSQRVYCPIHPYRN
jgi:hypothetical protein